MPRVKSSGKPTTRRYTDSVKDQPVRLVRQLREELGTDHGTVQRIADKRAPAKPYVGVSAATEEASARFVAALGGTRPVGYQRYQWGLPVWTRLVRANSSTAWWTDLATHIDWLVYEISAEMDMFTTAILAATGAEPTTPTAP